ncbi:MAG: hypothetical protein ACYDHY_09600 [Acidiferrobacterales bacterium]
MQTKNISIPSGVTDGLYRFVTPAEAVRTVVNGVRYSAIYEQWHYEVLSAAKRLHNRLLPPDRARFLVAFRLEFGDDVDALTDDGKMRRYGATSREAVQEARACMYGE